MLSRFWWEGGGAQMLLLVPHTTVIKTNKQREQTETKTSAWGGLSLSLSLYFSLSMCSFKCDLCSINFHSSSFFPLIPTLSHSHKRIFLSNLPKMCNGKTIFFSIEGGRGTDFLNNAKQNKFLKLFLFFLWFWCEISCSIDLNGMDGSSLVWFFFTEKLGPQSGGLV